MLVLRDTRESGEMLQAALAAGVSAAGGDALLGGVLPTPAAPAAVDRYGLTSRVVLSASHNPYQDNGIKFFAGDGYKLSDESELAIERELEPLAGHPARPRRRSGVSASCAAHRRTTCASCTRASPSSTFMALDVLLDCANGATYQVAPEIFRRLGARVTALADSPDGRNINAGCGSTHIDELAARGPRRRARARLRVRRRRRSRCWRRTVAARSSTATSCSRWRRSTCATPGACTATASR